MKGGEGAKHKKKRKEKKGRKGDGCPSLHPRSRWSQHTHKKQGGREKKKEEKRNIKKQKFNKLTKVQKFSSPVR